MRVNLFFFFSLLFLRATSRAGLQVEGGNDHRGIPGGIREGALRGRRRSQRGGLCLGVQQQRRELRGRAGQVRWQQRHHERARLHPRVREGLRRFDLLG